MDTQGKEGPKVALMMTRTEAFSLSILAPGHLPLRSLLGGTISPQLDPLTSLHYNWSRMRYNEDERKSTHSAGCSVLARFMVTICEFCFTVPTGKVRWTNASVRSLAGVIAGAFVLAWSVIGTKVEILKMETLGQKTPALQAEILTLIAVDTTPALFTNTIAGFATIPMDTFRITNTLVAVFSFPSQTALALVGSFAGTMFTIASGQTFRYIQNDSILVLSLYLFYYSAFWWE